VRSFRKALERSLEEDVVFAPPIHSRPITVQRYLHHPEFKAPIKAVVADVFNYCTSNAQDLNKKLHKYIIGGEGGPKAGRKVSKRRFIKSLKLLIIECLTGVEDGYWVGLSRTVGSFRKVTSRYNRLYITRTHLLAALDVLIFAGHVEQKIGFIYRHPGGVSRNTRIRATAKMRSICFGKVKADCTLSLLQSVSLSHKSETIVLRQAKVTKAEKMAELVEMDEMDALEESSKKHREVEYEDTDETIAMRQNVARINERLRESKIELPERGIEAWRNWLREQQEKRRKKSTKWKGLSENQIQEAFPDLTRNQLYRVFSKGSIKFDFGGRFYGAWWIGVPKVVREHITIDGQDVCELDFSTLHSRILYDFLRIPAEGDLYAPIVALGFSRKTVRTVTNALLNADDRESAEAAIRWKVNKREIDRTALKAIDPILELHQVLSDYFFDGVGLRLQNTDSKIAEGVMLSMLDAQKYGVVHGCVLPIHDSFICVRSDVDSLRMTMRVQYEKEVGVKPRPEAIKKEFPKDENVWQVSEGILLPRPRGILIPAVTGEAAVIH
jgi:hypothetical protein